MATTTDTHDTRDAEEQRQALSTDPADYTPSTHFIIRMRRGYGPASETRTDPPITTDVVKACIQRGRIEAGREDAVRFVADVKGTTWSLIVLPEDGAGMILTAYSVEDHGVEHVEVTT